MPTCYFTTNRVWEEINAFRCVSVEIYLLSQFDLQFIRYQVDVNDKLCAIRVGCDSVKNICDL